MLMDSGRPYLQPEHASVYSDSYWQFVDSQVLAASVGRRRRIPSHLEPGLNGIHHLDLPREPWWRGLERTPWKDVLYVAIVVAALAAAIVISGKGINLP